jgi:hypothetical protein
MLVKRNVLKIQKYFKKRFEAGFPSWVPKLAEYPPPPGVKASERLAAADACASLKRFLRAAVWPIGRPSPADSETIRRTYYVVVMH